MAIHAGSLPCLPNVAFLRPHTALVPAIVTANKCPRTRHRSGKDCEKKSCTAFTYMDVTEDADSTCEIFTGEPQLVDADSEYCKLRLALPLAAFALRLMSERAVTIPRCKKPVAIDRHAPSSQYSLNGFCVSGQLTPSPTSKLAPPQARSSPLPLQITNPSARESPPRESIIYPSMLGELPL